MEYKERIIGFKANPKIQEMIDGIKDRSAARSSTAVIYRAIEELYRQYFKDYIEIIKNRPAPLARLTPEEAAERKVQIGEEQKAFKEKREYEAQKAICEALDGEEYTTQGGAKVCKYRKYQYGNFWESEVEFIELSDILVKNQYNPDKETCLRLVGK